MKKTICIFLVGISLAVIPDFLYAHKWRINNSSVNANFTQIHQAVASSSVVNGDTLYVEGSAFNYEDVSITKRLVIIGPGYFLGENDSTQANLNAAAVSSMNFYSNSKGSVLMGITVSSYLNVRDTSIVVKRCKINQTSLQNCANCLIIQNVLNTLSISNAMNIIVSNNLFTSADGYNIDLNIYSSASAVVTNNIFKGPQIMNNTTLRNNIATGLGGTGNEIVSLINCISDHNLGASTQYGTSGSNQQNVDMSQVFVNTASSDGKYKLKAGSPAIGAGVDGVDCGIYGGNYPYVLSGMPEVPAIWYLNVNGSNVTVKAKSH
jgi:hypothetical protein